MRSTLSKLFYCREKKEHDRSVSHVLTWLSSAENNELQENRATKNMVFSKIA